MIRSVRSPLAWALLTLVLGTSQPARAQRSAQDSATARALFDEGRALAKDGKYAAACPKFEESSRIEPGIGTSYNLADCYEHVGRTASAWSVFLEAASKARLAGQVDREKAARDRADALAPKLARLTVVVPAQARVPGLEVRRDGSLLGEPMWGQALPVDPGKHTVRVSAPGYRPWSSEFEGSPEKSQSVSVPPLIKITDSSSGPTADADATSPPSGNSQRTAGLVVAGVGVVGVAVGSVFGLKARSKWNDAQSHCEARLCDDAGVSLTSDAKTAATLSTIGFGVGMVGLVTGAVLWLSAPSKSKDPVGSIGLAPLAGPAATGLTLDGRF